MSTPLYSKLSNVFTQMDTEESGSVSASQFKSSFSSSKPPAKFAAAGADAVWSQLDTTQSGSVTRQEFVNGLAKLSATMKGDGTVSSAKTSSTVSSSYDGLNLSA